MQTSEFIDRMNVLAKSRALVQVILAFAAGGVNLAGVVIAASAGEVRIGGQGYEIILNPFAIISIDSDTPFGSASPAAARMSERFSRAYDLKLNNGDRITIYELIEKMPPQH